MLNTFIIHKLSRCFVADKTSYCLRRQCDLDPTLLGLMLLDNANSRNWVVHDVIHRIYEATAEP